MGEVVAGILLAAAILGALALIGRALWWVWKRILQPLAQFADDWLGEPKREGISPGRPGVLARLTSLEAGVTAMRDHLATVDRLERRVAAIETQLRPNDGIEAGGMGFQAERAFELNDTGTSVRLAYGFTEQRSR